MNPLNLTELTKKHGSIFLLWCAIGYLYTELSGYKNELKEVRSELYNCMELRVNSQNASLIKSPEKIYFYIPKKRKYAIKGIKATLEV